jgi:hypothetical protein
MERRGGFGSFLGWPLPKLMFLLGYAADPSGFRNSVAHFGRDRDFFVANASGWHTNVSGPHSVGDGAI